MQGYRVLAQRVRAQGLSQLRQAVLGFAPSVRSDEVVPIELPRPNPP
jgi:hypothetical protein